MNERNYKNRTWFSHIGYFDNRTGFRTNVPGFAQTFRVSHTVPGFARPLINHPAS